MQKDAGLELQGVKVISYFFWKHMKTRNQAGVCLLRPDLCILYAYTGLHLRYNSKDPYSRILYCLNTMLKLCSLWKTMRCIIIIIIVSFIHKKN